MHISVYKKRKDRSLTNEPNEELHHKYSARHIKDNKLSDRETNRPEFATISKNSPFQKYYANGGSGNNKRKKTRSKKHHVGSEVLLKEQNMSQAFDKNYSVSITSTIKPLSEMYKQPNVKFGRYKKEKSAICYEKK